MQQTIRIDSSETRQGAKDKYEVFSTSLGKISVFNNDHIKVMKECVGKNLLVTTTKNGSYTNIANVHPAEEPGEVFQQKVAADPREGSFNVSYAKDIVVAMVESKVDKPVVDLMKEAVEAIKYARKEF